MAHDLPVLALNADYQPLSYCPLSIWSWQDAVHSVFRGRAVVVEEYDRVIRSPSLEIRMPSVIALKRYAPPAKRVAFTRFNVFLRDRFRCQYCGGTFDSRDLTFDHVIPRCDGGQTTWENIVAACSPCNTTKDRRRMRPLAMPREPTAFEMAAAQRQFPPGHLHETWLDYLYWDSELQET